MNQMEILTFITKVKFEYFGPQKRLSIDWTGFFLLELAHRLDFPSYLRDRRRDWADCLDEKKKGRIKALPDCL